ncbi:MAG: hypothetical protein KatS3mg050_0776 [Litorilinea sp.]|nr:MAG: hypothetical protein KatS3mg050_0776 [Litorilinea sp.]
MPLFARVVVDTNILFSALLSPQSRFASIILTQEADFYICESVIIELFEHKERLITISRLPPSELLAALHILLRHLHLYQERNIGKENLQRGYELCRAIDVDDALHVALTLELDGLLWTGDKKLREGLQVQGFNRFFVPGQ